MGTVDIVRAVLIAWMVLIAISLFFPPGVDFKMPENRPEWAKLRRWRRARVRL